MSSSPIISVVIPNLNRAGFLRPTIDSILSQNYPKIECLVIDGGSIDESLKILKSYGHKISWISEPDKGQVDAINKGWQKSHGEILAWLNADDVWADLGAAGRVVKYFQRFLDADLIYGDCGKIDATGKIIGMSYLHGWDLAYSVENCDFCISQPAAFVKKEIVEKIGWLDPGLYHRMDHDLWLRVGLVGKILYVPDLLGHARVLPTGVSQNPEAAAKYCVKVIDKFFSLPKIPKEIKKIEKRAKSNSYLRGVEYAYYLGPKWKLIIEYSLKATLIDVSNIFRVKKQFLDLFCQAFNNRNRFLFYLFKIVWLIGKLPELIRIASKTVTNFFNRYPKGPAYSGDRYVEWSWIMANIPPDLKQVLDFGPGGGSYLSLVTALKNFNVTLVDLGPMKYKFAHSKLHFVKGDILKINLPENYYDLVISCSTVEHVGLKGRYNIKNEKINGDLIAMMKLKSLLTKNGTMLLTIPVGQDVVVFPYHRVYGKKRLPMLLKGFKTFKCEFWSKKNDKWQQVEKLEALSTMPSKDNYSLGCFVLVNF